MITALGVRPGISLLCPCILQSFPLYNQLHILYCEKPEALMHNRISPFPKFPWQLSKLDYCQPMLHKWILLFPSSWHWFILSSTEQCLPIWATYFYSHRFQNWAYIFCSMENFVLNWQQFHGWKRNWIFLQHNELYEKCSLLLVTTNNW